MPTCPPLATPLAASAAAAGVPPAFSTLSAASAAALAASLAAWLAFAWSPVLIACRGENQQQGRATSQQYRCQTADDPRF